MWYLDCYSWQAACGRDFPVNSYCSESLEVVISHANLVLAQPDAGIDEVRISRETKGQSPVYVTFPRQTHGTKRPAADDPCRG